MVREECTSNVFCQSKISCFSFLFIQILLTIIKEHFSQKDIYNDLPCLSRSRVVYVGAVTGSNAFVGRPKITLKTGNTAHGSAALNLLQSFNWCCTLNPCYDSSFFSRLCSLPLTLPPPLSEEVKALLPQCCWYCACWTFCSWLCSIHGIPGNFTICSKQLIRVLCPCVMPIDWVMPKNRCG